MFSNLKFEVVSEKHLFKARMNPDTKSPGVFCGGVLHRSTKLFIFKIKAVYLLSWGHRQDCRAGCGWLLTSSPCLDLDPGRYQSRKSQILLFGDDACGDCGGCDDNPWEKGGTGGGGGGGRMMTLVRTRVTHRLIYIPHYKIDGIF